MNSKWTAILAIAALGGCATASAEDPRTGAVPLANVPEPAAYDVGPVAATRAAIARIERIDPRVGSVIAIDPTAIEQARRVAAQRLSGPLAGTPVLIKDNIEVAGPLPTTAGSLALANNITNRDAPLVARLRSAGAVILGKTNLSEWANFRSSRSISGWSFFILLMAR